MSTDPAFSLWPPAPDWRAWRHVTKIDPERPLDPATLEAVYTSGTDAIMVGGSTGMTGDAVFFQAASA